MAYLNHIQRIISLLLLGLLLQIPFNLIAQSELSFDIFTLENGLPNNRIQCIYQDNKGWIWAGTNQGLSRFDGYRFINFLPNENDTNSLQGNLVRVIKEDHKGNLLIGTETGGLNVFNRETETFSFPLKNLQEFNFKEISVNDIVINQNNDLWLATDFNILKLDTLHQVSILNYKNKEISLSGRFVRTIKLDSSKQLWIGTNDGLFLYDCNTEFLQYIDLPFKDESNKEIWEIFIDTDGMVWIGTYSSGLFTIDPINKQTTRINLVPELPRTETVRAISKGNFGEYWIGTRGGLYSYSKEKGVTGFFRNNLQEPKSLSNNSVLSVFQDINGETWIGTRNGLNLLAKSKQVFKNFTALPGNDKYLNSGTIWAFWIDPEENIWIGTEDGGINIYNKQTNNYRYITSDGPKNYALSKNCVKKFLHDGKGNLWVGTYMGGIDVINLKTGLIKNYSRNPDKKNSLSDNRIWDMCLDSQGNIWIVTSQGLNKFDAGTQSFIHLIQVNGNERILWIEPDSKGNLWMGSSDEVIVFNPESNQIKRFFEHSRTMFEDSHKEIWITTDDKGIARYSVENGPLEYFTESNGLVNNQTLCILEDNFQNLWVSTSNGLSKFNPRNQTFQNFTVKEGLSNNQFSYGASYKTKDGELLFGTISGFNKFNPDDIKEEDANVPLVFTDFRVFNKKVEIGSGKKKLLEKSISETKLLVLDYNQNVFTLEFAALNYVNTANNIYTYKLEGFNSNWVEPSKDRTATYTNLNPGDYVFMVKRVIPGSNVDSEILELNIKILPPFWKTNWFLALIFFIILILIYVLVQFFINREKIKSQLVLERVKARKLHELDMMKLKFFTNISHEIRTPLTLILGPLEKMLNNNSVKKDDLENLKLMHRNAKNLDKLINQLLDFRKLQSGNLKLNLTEADIVAFLKNIVDSFHDFAEEKQVNLSFNTLKKTLFISFDPDKIEKIMNNLLSNAFKFTEPNDSISVNVSVVFDSEDEEFSDQQIEKRFVEIYIKDTGRGISTENVNKIFTRFFQSNKKDTESGAGIGLALVNDLVKLHMGKINVTSKLGKGTKFTIRIPVDVTNEKSVEKSEIRNKIQNGENLLGEKIRFRPDDSLHSKIMLIVEDNSDVRQFIKGHFDTIYTIYEASNGEKGWEKALKLVPDIIISDILMPKLNGYDLCKKIKNDERTSHIPVILLTAMHSKEHELKGLTTGADDYITKPFDLSVLQAKVENILSIRESLKERYTDTVVLEPTNVVLSSPDERFLQKAMDVVEANISDGNLDIESFAKKVGVSRMQLYRKLHALTNMTVKEFIRHIRLKRAAQLLIQKKLNVSEVAYEVGFNDLSHFRKCFKQEFGMSATEYITNAKEKSNT